MDKALETAFGVFGSVLPPERTRQFDRLYSQTSAAEREALYAVARYAYTGEGEIFDVGTAAGGSTYCLAAGVLDSAVSDKAGRVHGFDLFDGFSLKTFAERGLAKEGQNFASDLEFFDWHTREVSSAIVRVPANLITEPGVLRCAEKVEIAHIDAAKSLSLWKAIFAAIAPSVIPGKTIWIFQDFEIISQPWQIYGLNELLKAGEFIGGASYATMYFRFMEALAPRMIAKIAGDDFSLEEKLDGVDAVYRIVARDYPHLFPGPLTLDELRTATKAHCHGMAGDVDHARALVKTLSLVFRSHPGMKGHLTRFKLEEA